MYSFLHLLIIAIGAVLVVGYLLMYMPMLHDKTHWLHMPSTNFVMKFFSEGSYNASSLFENAVFAKLQQAAEGAVLNKPLVCKNKLYDVAMTIKSGAPTKYTTDTLSIIWDEYSNRVMYIINIYLSLYIAVHIKVMKIMKD